MFKYYSISFFLIDVLLLFITVLVGSGLILINSSFTILSNFFIFDSISFYLIVLILFLGIYSYNSFYLLLNSETIFYLFLSLFFSCLCFCINNVILFWCFYELSMLPLLYLIFKESPYSERFLAGWYFSCYLLITSLPLILLLVYLSILNNSYFFTMWTINSVNIWLLILLSFVFFTKVPLTPFHTWLPIVHAEATSIVSIFLSGYIMKLGLLGVFRCSYNIFDSFLINYLFLCLIMSIFFLITSSGELDGKRWLAFLSLAHIVVPFIIFFIGDYNVLSCSFFYCLGHGLSAGIVFGLLWYLYDLSNSRNWLLLKSSINFKSVMYLVVFSLLSLCSFPPTIQFFSELALVKISASSFIYIIFWCFYLFFGGLVPLVLCGNLLIRSEWIDVFDCNTYNYFNFLLLLCFWCYLGLFLI